MKKLDPTNPFHQDAILEEKKKPLLAMGAYLDQVPPDLLLGLCRLKHEQPKVFKGEEGLFQWTVVECHQIVESYIAAAQSSNTEDFFDVAYLKKALAYLRSLSEYIKFLPPGFDLQGKIERLEAIETTLTEKQQALVDRLEITDALRNRLLSLLGVVKQLRVDIGGKPDANPNSTQRLHVVNTALSAIEKLLLNERDTL